VQSGTLNSLVDILVHGLHNVSVSVADDNGEMSLRERMPRELKLDHHEFAIVWWAVFRSFVTPLVLFEVRSLSPFSTLIVNLPFRSSYASYTSSNKQARTLQFPTMLS
jgi:hypothetical protein